MEARGPAAASDAQPTTVRKTRSPELTNEVHTAVRGSTSVLVVVSPDLVASARCRHEMERAIALRKRVVLVNARATPLENLPEELRQLDLVYVKADDFDGE